MMYILLVLVFIGAVKQQLTNYNTLFLKHYIVIHIFFQGSMGIFCNL